MELKPGVLVMYHPAELDKDCTDLKGKGLPAMIVEVADKTNLPRLCLRVFTNSDGCLPLRVNVAHISNKIDYLDYYTYDEQK